MEPPVLGSLKDSRDGRTYRTLTYKNQTWMAENIAIGATINSNEQLENNGIIEKYIYEDDEKNAAKGGLYTWDEAMQYSIAAGSQGICPQGWHLPTDEEWHAFEKNIAYFEIFCDQDRRGEGCVGAGWRLLFSDEMDFHMDYIGTKTPAHYGAPFMYAGNYLRFWSSSEHDSLNAVRRGSEKNRPTLDRDYYPKAWGYAVRCIKDLNTK